MAKERDNTWLQLPICPVLWRQKETKIGQVTTTTTTTSTCCPETKDCHRSYAHPPEHVLNQALASGFVVCCQAFVFSNYAPDDGTVFRPKCKRGEESCRYYHPPKHLGLQVINMGRNNKRMKQEMISKMKLAAAAAQQQSFYTAAAAAAVNPLQHAAVNSPLFYSPLMTTPYTIQSTSPRSTALVASSGFLPATADDQASTSALLRKRPRSPQNATSTSLQSPEPKRRSKELDPTKLVLNQGFAGFNTAGGHTTATTVEMVSPPAGVMYLYDVNTGLYFQ